MANIKQYRSNAKIPGLPDTTNITDPQLRLFLDRLKLVVTNLTVTVDGLAKYNNVDNIVRDLTNSQYFNSIIDQKVTDISTGIVKSEVKKNNNKKNKIVELDAIEIDPVEMTLNVFNAETASGTAEVYYVPHDTSPMYKGVTWSVSDDTVATIDQNGNVTALAVGKCTITATSNYDNDMTAEAFLEVVYADTITVTATYQWCSQNSNIVCFTEIQEPVDGNCIWSATENTVTLLPDKTEEEAKAASAFTTIATADRRKWISTAYPDWASGKRFWRDEEKDVDYRPVAVQELVPCALSTGNRWNGTNVGTVSRRIFTSNQPEYSGNTGKVYNRGCPNTWDIGIAKQYLLEDAEVLASDLPFIRVPSELATKYSDEWYKQGYPILLSLRFANETAPGGLAVSVPCRSSGRTMVLHNQTWYHYKSQSLPGHYEQTHDIWATQGSTGDYGSIFIDTEPNEDYNGQLMDMVSFWYYWLDYDGSLWVVGSDEHSRYYLYEIAQYPAWTLSPCHQTGVSDDQITVYTDPNTLPDDVTAGDEEAGTYPTNVYIPYNQDYEGDGVIDETYWMPEGQVTATGEGTYSITGNNGGTYYRH